MVMFQGGHQIGEIHGLRELVKYDAYTNKHHQWYWKCLECNVIQPRPASMSWILNGKRCKTCAVSRKNHPQWAGYEDIGQQFMYQYRKSAIRRNLEFNVTVEEIWQLWLDQDGKCWYTGWQLEHGVDASLDRIDSSKGYTLSNVKWVHRDINRMKTDFPETRFLEMSQAVAERQSVDYTK